MIRPPQAPAKSALSQSDTLPDSLMELSACLQELQDETRLWQDYIRQLYALENAAQGRFYPAQLHEAKQFKMQLEYKQACCRAKINRIKMMEEF